MATGNGWSVAPRDRATLEEVAELAGVSRATVSRVINGKPRVSRETRVAVERAAARLGYVPNRAARSLVTRRNDSIGLVIPEPSGQFFNDPLFPRLVRGVTEGLAEPGVQLVLFMPQSSRDEARLADYLGGGHVDGVLIVSLHGLDELPLGLKRQGIPVVVCGRPLAAADLSYVDADNQRGAMRAVAHLVEQGRQVIATVAGPQDMAPGIDRLEGYRQGLRAAGRDTCRDLGADGARRHERAAPARAPRARRRRRRRLGRLAGRAHRQPTAHHHPPAHRADGPRDDPPPAADDLQRRSPAPAPDPRHRADRAGILGRPAGATPGFALSRGVVGPSEIRTGLGP